MIEQREHRRTERIVVYVTPDWDRRLQEAIIRDDFERADWLRHALEKAIGESEVAATDEGAEGRSIPVEVRLAVAEERIRGLEEDKRALQTLANEQKDRQGHSDALNQQLSRQLEAAHGTIERVTLALPAAGQTGRRWWQFWS